MGAPWPPRGPDDLDEARRARIRRDVLGRLRTGRPGARDHAYAVVSVLAAPAPYIVRVAVSLALVAAIVGSATVASADALPDEPLYGLKVASEQVRLALARTPADRAAVRLSMAEHRLAEAERLATMGREPDALVASSAYGTHLAQAAAELAAVERLHPEGRALVGRLKERLAEQQRRAVGIAARLAADPASAPAASAFETVASAPPAEPSGTLSELIADHAASVTDQLAAVAEQRAAEAGAAETRSEPPPAVAEPVAAAGSALSQPEAATAASGGRAQRGPPVGSVAVAVPGGASEDRAARGAKEQERADERAQRERRDAARAEREQAERERVRGDDEEEGREGDRGRPPSREREGRPEAAERLQERLEKLRQQYLAALERIKERQKEAREAAKVAKERGKHGSPEHSGDSDDSDDSDDGEDSREGEDSEDSED